MAWEDIAERMEGKGWLGVGIGAVILAPVLLPAVAKGLRPALKGAVKGYLALSDKTREWLAESGEQLQDLVAEARAEYETQSEPAELMAMELPADGEAEGGVEDAPATMASADSAPSDEAPAEPKSRTRRHGAAAHAEAA